jgi:hypothetical protein
MTTETKSGSVVNQNDAHMVFEEAIRGFNVTRVTVYTNEADYYMFKLFFPDIKCNLSFGLQGKVKYIPDEMSLQEREEVSFGFWEGEILKDVHTLNIVRNLDETKKGARVFPLRTIKNFTLVSTVPAEEIQTQELSQSPPLTTLTNLTKKKGPSWADMSEDSD